MQKISLWHSTIIVTSLIIALVMQGPQILHMLSPLYQGIPVQLNSDEAIYLARTQEALSGRGEQAAEAFIGDPELVGTQTELIARTYGMLFGWTGVRAPTLLAILDSVEPVLVFLLIILFFYLAGFTKWQAYGGALAFVLLQLYNLNRPVHMRASFIVMLAALVAIQLALQHRKYWRFIAGGLLGLLVGVYLWSWTFAWSYFGVLALVVCVEWWLNRTHKRKQRINLFMRVLQKLRIVHQKKSDNKDLITVLSILLVGIIAAAPFVFHLWKISLHPLYEYGVFRSGMHTGHMPESVVYSALFGVMCVGILYDLYRNPQQSRVYKTAYILPIAAFVYMNQQVVHGITFNFVSHAIFSLALAAITCVLLAIRSRTTGLFVAAVAACIYLAAIGYDGRYVLAQWSVHTGRFSQQHFATALPVLGTVDRTTILSDPKTSAFIAGATSHDIVYSVYLKNVLLTHQEIAERYCMTQLALDPSRWVIAEEDHLIYPDANSAFGNPADREQEVQLVQHACQELAKNPANALDRFSVNYILWDEVAQPNWDLSRFQAALEEVAQGEGWSLWKVL